MVKVPDTETEYLVTLGTFKISAVNEREAVEKLFKILRDPDPPHYAIKVKQIDGIDNYFHFGLIVDLGSSPINDFEIKGEKDYSMRPMERGGSNAGP